MTTSLRARSACLRIAAGLMLSLTGTASLAEDQSIGSKGEAVTAAGEVIFAVRRPGEDEHWYANFGYYCDGPERPAYTAGARLCRLDVATGDVTVLLEDPEGGIRDPQVHYDGTKILFSYRRGGSGHYHLYEINADGTGLRQITDGPYDDIEPSYLPDGGILFCSSRCNRWVKCWLVQVAVLYRCDGDGTNIRAISAANATENTPWMLPDGRVLYTRWEYVDRSQVHYHHLWVMNPDGTGQSTFFGNLHPGTVMIDAKPIPETDQVVAIFSPGHGRREHAGAVTIVDPGAGPDAPPFARPLTSADNFRDPFPVSRNQFLAARSGELVAISGRGEIELLYELPETERKAGLELHEPRPLIPRPREPVIPDRVDPTQATGKLVLADIYEGRNMDGVERGEIKKLLVLETLPKPINYTGGMDPLTYGGSFSLERVVGTVPVEPDGSAYMELPALRSLFFVALDKNDMAVKRMQSFVTVQPGELTSCVGCHEQRSKTALPSTGLVALRRGPSQIEPIPDVPEVFDFPRDIQPVLDSLCADCHGYEQTEAGGPRAGGVILTGDHGPMFSHSYYMLTIRSLFSDGRNDPKSSYEPRAIGSSASRILTMLDGSHHGVHATDHQRKMLRLWIETAATYPGTYAALGTGMIGGYHENRQVEADWDWPVTKAAADVIARRCDSCHSEGRVLPKSLSDERNVSFWRPGWDDPRLKYSRHIVFNLSRPEASLILLAPLSKEAGGYGLCRKIDAEGKADGPVTVFADKRDPDYQKLLAMCQAGHARLAEIKRFDMPGFQPRPEYIREMRRYGILPGDSTAEGPIDPYAIDRAYWRSLWYQPKTSESAKAAERTATR